MKKLNCILALALLCLLLPIKTFALDLNPDAKTTIKVGYTDYYSFIKQTADGEYEGYGVDYLNEIAKHTDWQYEFIYCGWETALEKLKADEIDILCNATQDTENRGSYNFSQHSIGVEQFVLYCLPKADLWFDDFEKFNGKNVGILKSSANAMAFDAYAKKNGFSYNKKEFLSDNELKDALSTGTVDAIATAHIAPYDSLKLIARYGSSPIYIITSKTSAIAEEINSAISIIKADNPRFDGELYTKHYGASMSAVQLMFTRQEIEFIKNTEKVKLGIWAERIPVSYIDPITKTTKGISKAIMDEISKISGINFEYVTVSPLSALVDVLAAGTVDIICGPPNLDNYFENKNMKVSTPYHTSKLVFVSKGADIDLDTNLKIASLKTTKAINAYIEKEHPKLEMLFADSIYESLKMVESGRADVALCNEYSAAYYLQKPVFSKLFALADHSIDEPSVIVGLDTTNPVLMSIINKSIAVMDKSRMEKIVIAQVANTSYERTVDDFLYQYGAALFTLFLMGAIWIYLISKISTGRQKSAAALKKINDELTLQQKRYETVLAQTNDIIFEWNYITKDIEHSTNFEGHLGRQANGANFPFNEATVNNVHPDDYDACIAMYTSYDKGALCAVGEFRLKDKDNKYIWFRSRSTAILDDKGNVVKVLGMLSDINSEKRKLIAVENQAKKDNLTGIYNRKAAEELIESYIENDVNGALFIIDVDDFKAINDTYGHQSGDEVLVDVAKELGKLFRSGDVVSRLGGDEFMVFMADISQSYDIGHKARELVKSIDSIQNGDASVSVSVGVSIYPQDGVSFAALYQKADMALYRSKKNGKNQYAIWEG